MKEVIVSLQHFWLKHAGTFYCSLSFTINDCPIESQSIGEFSNKLTSVGNAWKIGPITFTDCGISAQSLEDLQFAAAIPVASTNSPCSVNFQIFQDPPTYNPIASQDGTNLTDPLLLGTGKLQLTTLSPWISDDHTGESKQLFQRVNIVGTNDIGRLPVNLGWVGIKTVLHEKRVDESVQLETVKLTNIEGDRCSPKTTSTSSPENFQVLSQFDSIKPAPIAIYEPIESFPSIDAVEQMLPTYYRLVNEHLQKRNVVKPYAPINCITPDSQPRFGQSQSAPIAAPNAGVSCEITFGQAVDQHLISVLEYQTKELDRHRTAIRKMGELVVNLRHKISDLEIIGAADYRDSQKASRVDICMEVGGRFTEFPAIVCGNNCLWMKNSQLRSELYYIDGNSNTNICASTKHSGSVERRLMVEQIEEQKVLLQKQQNEVIMKNEYEKKYLKLLKAHQSQQAILLEYQAKFSRYQRIEKICKRQEKIILELESCHSKSRKERMKLPENLALDGRMVSVENNMLALQHPSSFKQSVPQQTGTLKNIHISETEERMVLLQKLEKSEGRIMALEKQLFENTRHWAHEKSHLKLKAADGFHDNLKADGRFPAPLALPRNHQTDNINENFHHFRSLTRRPDAFQ